VDLLEAQDNDLLELLGKNICPLRAWIAVDPGVQPGIVPLDPVGQSILGVAPKDKVNVQRITATTRYYPRDTECTIIPLRGEENGD
jgi:hypothetical protein